MTLRLFVPLFLAVSFVLVPACGPKTSAPPPTPVEDVIPLTMANIKGHEMLYNEGWFVVTSSKKALEFAKENSFRSSRESMRMIAQDVVNRSKDLKSDVTGDAKKTYDQSVHILKTGATVSGGILAGSLFLASEELGYAGETAQKALSRFVKGNMAIVRRGAQDVSDLKDLPGHYFTHLKNDFSNIRSLSETVNGKVSEAIGLSWEESFNRAAEAFQREYEQSGTRPNTLSALGDILAGYLEAFYRGIAEPGAKSLVEYTAKGTNTAVFLPTAAITVFGSRTVEATGLSLVYAARTGYHVIAPTMEAGLLSGLALFSAAAAPATLAAGTGLSAVNQVAFTTASPVYLAGKTVSDTVADTGKYVALVTYDVSRNSSHVMINHAKTAVVLGYNALSAVPVHLFLGTLDTAVFLGWDGPRLVLAMARGTVSFDAGDAAMSMGDLPAGTVVDLEALNRQKNLDVEILTDDPAIIGRVLEKLPEDVRGNK